MPSPYSGNRSVGASLIWDDEGAFPLGSDGGGAGFAAVSAVTFVTGRYAKTSLPAPHRVDMVAELARIRRILTVLRAEDSILIEIALDEARYQLAKPQPNVDKIGAAVQRALDLASRDQRFDDRREALIPPLRHVCAWLGGPWYRLLGFVSLTF